MNLGKVGMIFNGGGFAGAYSVGFAKALAARGIKPDFVQSVSVGVLTGGDLTGTNWDVASLEKKWKAVERLGPGKIFGRKWAGFLRNFRGPNLFSNDGMARLLVDGIDLEAIAASPVPFQIVTYNEKHLRHEIFSNHDPAVRRDPKVLRELMLAAIGLQGFLPPVMVNGEWHSDAGTFVLSEAIRAKCDTVFILSNRRLCHSAYADTGRLPWYLRIAFRVELGNSLLEMRGIRHAMDDGYELVENNPCGVFVDTRPRGKRQVQKLKKIINGVRKALTIDPEGSAVPQRVVLLTPTRPIPSLGTRDFLKGDITAAIDQAFGLAENESFWSKLAAQPAASPQAEPLVIPGAA